jgi:hypothetical protein
MALRKTKGVQLFSWEKTVGNGDYKVMSKINPLINLMFLSSTNNTVLASNNSKKIIGCHESFTIQGEAIEISAQYFNKTMNSMKSTLDHFSSQHRD